MKNKILNTIIIITTILIFIEIIIKNNLILLTVNNSLNIWVNTLIPSLFPFFIISDILIDYNIIEYIPPKIKIFLCKIFNISNNALSILLLSIISGFPSNARNTKHLYQNKLISKKEAEHILIFSHFSNPLFIITTIGTIFLKNKKLGYIILLSHISSNILLGILCRNKNIITNININKNNKKKSLGKVLSNSIKHALDSLSLIFGTLTIFLIITNIIISLLCLPTNIQAFIKSLFEITIGLKSISQLHIENITKIILCTMVLSFGGISVQMQVISELIDTDINYKPYLIGRIIQSIISIPLSIIFYYVIIP